MKIHHIAASAVMLAAFAASVAPAGAHLTRNSLTHNSLTHNSLTHNSLTHNGVAPTSSALGELNGVAVEAVTPPEEPTRF